MSPSTLSPAPPVIDSRAPRFNQAFIALIAVSAYLFNAWPLLIVGALQLALALTLGPRACLACQVYFRLIVPRFGHGPVKDARPVRFANLVGLVFLSLASLAHWAGFPIIGWVLAGIVAGLAGLAAVSGVCVGCEMYRLIAFVRGIGPRRAERIDLERLGAVHQPNLVVQFTYPRCHDCILLEERLRKEGIPVFPVDVSKHPDLAKEYGIQLVPQAFMVDAGGRILKRVA